MEETERDMTGSGSLSLSTDHLAGAERFELWRDFSRQSVAGLDIETPEAHNFSVRASGRLLPGMGVMHLRSSPSIVTRDPDTSLDGRADHIVINLVRSGALLAEQDGRSVHVRPGGAVLCVADRPYALRFEAELDVMVLKIQRDMLSRASSLEDLTAIDLGPVGRTGRILMSYAAELAAFDSATDPVTAARLTRGAVDVLEAALGSLSEAAGPQTRHQLATVRRIKRFVLSELADPDLDTGIVARGVGLSPRYLNKLFEAEETTLWRFIVQQRLLRAARDLADAALPSLSIGEIARRNGFKDPNYFSSCFRSAFGMSPRAYREHRRVLRSFSLPGA